MTIDLNINLATVTSVVTSAGVLFKLIHTIRNNDLRHLDQKFDTTNKRIDDIFEILAKINLKE